MQRCPCCNARLRGATLCPRCQSDLSAVIGARQAAQFWLSKSIEYWQENEEEQSIDALMVALHLKKNPLPLVFRDFIIQQLCQAILEQLAQKQIIAAKQRFYRIRKLLPYSELLQQLQTFTDYLLINKPTDPDSDNFWTGFVFQQLGLGTRVK